VICECIQLGMEVEESGRFGHITWFVKYRIKLEFWFRSLHFLASRHLRYHRAIPVYIQYKDENVRLVGLILIQDSFNHVETSLQSAVFGEKKIRQIIDIPLTR
jgi:hypothetical protein